MFLSQYPEVWHWLNVVIVYLDFHFLSLSDVLHYDRHATSHCSRIVGVVGAILGPFQRRVSLPGRQFETAF